jgi:carboxylate-amine ligase
VHASPGRWPAEASAHLYRWNRFNAAKEGVDASWIDPETGAELSVVRAVADDLERLRLRSTDPDFPEACRLIHQLLQRGGQARWLTDHLDAGSGMNDLARVASEMFSAAAPGARPS